MTEDKRPVCGPKDWCYCTPRCVGHRPFIDYTPVKVEFSDSRPEPDEPLGYNACDPDEFYPWRSG